MQVTETLSEGLKRELRIVVASDELDRRLVERLEEIKNTVQLKGFRRGKVPISHLRRTFARRVMPEVVENVVQETSRQALDDREERPVVQPQIAFAEEGEELAGVIAGEADLTFTMAFEVMPPIESVEFSRIELDRPVATVGDKDVDDALEAIRKEQQSFASREAGEAARSGDRVTIDFVGTIDGEAFEGGTVEDAQLVLGSGSFVPGFEEQLDGVVAGEEREVRITFPEDYGATHLAGKEAVFKVTVRDVGAPVAAELDDTLAKGLGFDDLDKLKEAVRKQIESDFAVASRGKLKRRLLDALDERYRFELPPSLVDAEFDRIWSEVTTQMEQAERSFEDEGTTEDDARVEYRAIAERRVRLGLVLADIGEKNGITVTDEEVNRAILTRARQFPGQESQVIEFYRSNPQALSELRSPIVEDKVVDFIVELAQVSDAEVSREELFAEDHDHDHDHDHEHGDTEEKAKAKPRRKRAAKSKSEG